MPKVSKLKFSITSQYGEYYDIWYNAKDEPLFSIKGFPSDFTNVTGVYLSGYNTEKELEDSIYKALRIYKEAKKKQRKVILYSASASTELTANKIGIGSYQGRLKGVTEKIGSMSNVETASFGISYEVKMEVEMPDSKKYHRILEDGSLSWANDKGQKQQVMDWTPEREQFFKNIYSSMQDMVLKISLFIEKDSETAAFLIDTKQNLLI